jgi:hypothetical protein
MHAPCICMQHDASSTHWHSIKALAFPAMQGKGLSNNVHQVHGDFLTAAQAFQQVGAGGEKAICALSLTLFSVLQMQVDVLV